MPQRARLEGWIQGLDDIHRSDELGTDALRRAINIDISDSGKVARRRGSSQVYAGSIERNSLWSGSSRTLFVESGHLKELLVDSAGNFSSALVRLDVGARPMKYLELNGMIYYTNNVVTGMIGPDGEAWDWGVPNPQTQPNLTPGGSGELAPGTYQVAITWLNERGEESGTGLAAVTEVTAEDGSIQLSDFPPAPAGVSWVRVYCSHQNGEGLYRVADLIPGIPFYRINRVSNTSTLRLETQFGCPPFPGHLLEYHDGRIYIARDNVLWCTQPMRYNLTKPAHDFFQFPDFISVCLSVDSGLYVCSGDATYFITGIDTASLEQDQVLPYGGVYDTGIHIPHYDAVAWFSHRGIVLGGEQGDTFNVMEDRVAAGKYGFGTMLWREHRGIRQFVADLWDGESNSYASPDYVALETLRGGDFI